MHRLLSTNTLGMNLAAVFGVLIIWIVSLLVIHFVTRIRRAC